MTICVRHRDGWCATRRQKVPNIRRDASTDAQPTVCGQAVVAMGYDAEREPTCAECRERLGLEEE